MDQIWCTCSHWHGKWGKASEHSVIWTRSSQRMQDWAALSTMEFNNTMDIDTSIILILLTNTLVLDWTAHEVILWIMSHVLCVILCILLAEKPAFGRLLCSGACSALAMVVWRDSSSSNALSMKLFPPMADPVMMVLQAKVSKGPWQCSIEGHAMSVLPATVHQINNEGNNLI